MKQNGLQKIQFKIHNYNTCKQVRFIPKSNYIILEAVYEVKSKQLKPNNGRYMSIDLGVNNLCSVTSNICKSFIIDGKKLKHINHNYNKRKALLQSKLNKNQYTSKLINNITKKRNFRIQNYFHNVSKYIVTQAVNNQINTIVIGQNKGWKQETKFRYKNNTQNFIQIPFNKLIHMISYKAELQGIKVCLQEESYTSVTSFLDNDYIATYNVDNNMNNPSGNRKYRGLYVTKNGLKINSDINGSLNILRKYLKCNSDEIISPADVGFVVNPVKIKLFNC